MTTTTINALLASPPAWLDHSLSVLWLFLCTSLVTQKSHFLQVFYAFALSWAAAGLAMVVMRRSDSKQKQKTTFSDDEECQHVEHYQALAIKHSIALIALSASFTCYLRPTLQGAAAAPSSSSSSHAYSIVAGYLAFDHWFSALCRLHRPLRRILQDAIALTAAVVLHATTTAKSQIMNDSVYHPWVCMAYLAMDLVQHMRGLSALCETRPVSKVDTAYVDKAAKAGSYEASPTPATKQLEGNSADDSNSNTWSIHGVAYNLDDYVDRHPGGREAILLGKSRDCTALFDSYHPFTTAHLQVLRKYQVKYDKMNLKSIMRDEFYAVLSERVQAALQVKGIDAIQDRTATPLRRLYYIVVVACIVATGFAHCKGSILGSFLFAVFGWLLGALGHDAGHFCVSHNAFFNDACVWGMSLLCNPMLWQHQHTYAHHSHTNDFDQDPDLHHFETLLRVHKRFQKKGIHSWQANSLYVMFSYMFVVFGTCFWIPWGMLQDGASLYGMVKWTDRSRPLRYIGFAFHVIAYFGIIMVLPYFAHSSWLSAWGAVTAHVSTTGLIFAIFSQINHLNEASLDLNDKGDSIVDEKRRKLLASSWAAQQVETSNNFASQSVLWHFLSNGLNYQIEHHLFPGLNHCHLHHIAPVVKQTCEEFGVRYKCYETWSDIMQATLNWLDKLAADVDAELTANDPCKAD